MGAENTKKMKSSLKTWEWKILRKKYGPIKDQNGGESEIIMNCRLCIDREE
jgi:hypothetical protein